MFRFIKSLWWFISKNWYRYVSIVIVGLFLTVLNLVPAWIVSQLTDAIDKNELTIDFLFLRILVPFLITIILIY
ncbi:MAG: hypothetical protein K2I88_00990, partial [Anaeroplasmataceae bacterium]|nr:hypothetical protein [Anaeroplasmataceae bacterium]